MTIIIKASGLATLTIASMITICGHYTLNNTQIAYGNITDTQDATVAERYVNIEQVNSSAQNSAIGQIIDIKVNDDQTVRVGVTEKFSNVNYAKLKTDVELSVIGSQSNEGIEVREIVDDLDLAKEELKKEAEAAKIAKAKAELAKRTYSTSRTQGGLLDIVNPDESYTGKAIKIVGKDRDILERLVMGEAGNQGFEGAALVAQAIRDMYILGNYKSVDAVRTSCGYSGKMKLAPNQDVLDAVSYIFDEGGYAVKHRILYFYAPKYSKGKFHETQNLVISYKDHKVFDRK